jgi:hypothetical protein
MWSEQGRRFPMSRKYVTVSWTTRDVMEEAISQGVRLTREKAEDLLREIEEKLKADMLAIGWMVIARTVREKGGG